MKILIYSSQFSYQFDYFRFPCCFNYFAIIIKHYYHCLIFSIFFEWKDCYCYSLIMMNKAITKNLNLCFINFNFTLVLIIMITFVFRDIYFMKLKHIRTSSNFRIIMLLLIIHHLIRNPIYLVF